LEKENKNGFYGKSLHMSPNEKKISFLNRYMIFKKVRNVDGSKIMKMAMKNYEFVETDDNLKEDVQEQSNPENSEKEIVVKEQTKTKKTGKKRII
jgi:hypothetical protein